MRAGPYQGQTVGSLGTREGGEREGELGQRPHFRMYHSSLTLQREGRKEGKEEGENRKVAWLTDRRVGGQPEALRH